MTQDEAMVVIAEIIAFRALFDANSCGLIGRMDRFIAAVDKRLDRMETLEERLCVAELAGELQALGLEVSAL
jgi:hypothetical protein